MRMRMLLWTPLLILLATGCSDGHPVQTTTISGTVYLRDQPVPGGLVTFVSAKGHTANALIDSQGHFQITAPLGENKISVDNRMLLKVKDRPALPRLPNQPTTPTTSTPIITGTYVPIPEKYYQVDTSPLRPTNRKNLTQRRKDAKKDKKPGKTKGESVLLCSFFASLRLCVRFFLKELLTANVTADTHNFDVRME